jgi:miniconductance mechanosensitive channel
MMENTNMTETDLQQWMVSNPVISLISVLILSILTFLIARGILARGLIYIASHTRTKYDDIIVRNLRPFRVAWLAPLLLIYSLAYLLPDIQIYIEKACLFLILWVAAITINALINAANEVYESRPSFTGVSIQGYLDIVKILVIIVGIILSISLITDESPIVLLTGLGALTAVLLLIFRDTILSLMASIQISTQDLVKEGDWLEVPSYEADGEVINMTLHTIKVQNWDMTISVIPTYRMTEVAYKNWRGMEESGGRRIKRSIFIDLASIKFCDREMIERYRKVDIIQEYLDSRLHEIEVEINQRGIEMDSPLDGRQLTNVGTFRAYIEAYLAHHPDIHTEKMTFLVRSLAPGPTGLPLEIYVFSKTTEWIEYERIQAEVFDHLLAAASHFDLSVFQEPTGKDFTRLYSATSR